MTWCYHAKAPARLSLPRQIAYLVEDARCTRGHHPAWLVVVSWWNGLPEASELLALDEVRDFTRGDGKKGLRVFAVFREGVRLSERELAALRAS